MWKLIERASIVFGLLMAAGTLYYTAGLFYHWDQAPAVVPAQPVSAIVVTPWWVLPELGLAIILMAAGAAMMVMRSRQGKQSTYDVTSPLTRITGATYQNQDVRLDGYEFFGCTFENVTFRWDGNAPYSFIDVHTKGTIQLISKNRVINDAIILMHNLRENVAGKDGVAGLRNVPISHLPGMGDKI